MKTFKKKEREKKKASSKYQTNVNIYKY